jgi:hypothetical protein
MSDALMVNREYSAKEIMGWVIKDDDYHRGETYSDPHGMGMKCYIHQWRPEQDFEQLAQVARKAMSVISYFPSSVIDAKFAGQTNAGRYLTWAVDPASIFEAIVDAHKEAFAKSKGFEVEG